MERSWSRRCGSGMTFAQPPVVRRGLAVFGAVAMVLSLSGSAGVATRQIAPTLPATPISNAEFWRLSDGFSEPDGYFDSDNLLSNEDGFQVVIPALVGLVPRGGAYLGVGPEQNFAYLAALEPAIAFIVDVRRGNLQLHLLYKALLELSVDRVEFVSRLFARPRPVGLTSEVTADTLFNAFAGMPVDRRLQAETLAAAIQGLTEHRGQPISEADRSGMAYVHAAFVDNGPDITFVSSRPGNRYPTYRMLQTTDDGTGRNWSFLGSEGAFRRLQALQRENRVVPVVGDFGGRGALRAIGAYLSTTRRPVTVFYTSNVEQYLFRDGSWAGFVANLRSLPVDPRATFIRACFNSCSGAGGRRAVTLLDSIPGLLSDFAAGRIRSYFDVIAHGGAR